MKLFFFYIYYITTLARVEVKNGNVLYALSRIRSSLNKEGTLQTLRRKRYFLSESALRNFELTEKSKERKKQRNYRQNSLLNQSNLISFFHAQLKNSKPLFDTVSGFPIDDSITLHKPIASNRSDDEGRQSSINTRGNNNSSNNSGSSNKGSYGVGKYASESGSESTDDEDN